MRRFLPDVPSPPPRSVRSERPDEAAGRDDFIRSRLALGTLGLCCLPAYLVWRGVPGGPEVALAVCLAAPIAACFALSLGWPRAAGHALSAVGGAGIVGAFLAASGPAGWPALLLLAAEPLDALRSRTRAGGIASLAAAGPALAAGAAMGDASGAGQICAGVLAAGWLAYATALAIRDCRARRPADEETPAAVPAFMPARSAASPPPGVAERTLPAPAPRAVATGGDAARPIRPALVATAVVRPVPFKSVRPSMVADPPAEDAPVSPPVRDRHPPRFRMIA